MIPNHMCITWMVYTLFTDAAVANGDLYNSRIKLHIHKITRFEINGMFIEEHPQYHEVQASIETLNGNVTAEKDKYFYLEQCLHSWPM